MNIALGIVLLLISVFLIVAVLMQSGKSHNLSGAIAGGAETFFGKTKGKSIDKVLSKVTTVVAIVFVLLVVIVYVVQEDVDYDALAQQMAESISIAAEESSSADAAIEGEVVEGEVVEGEAAEGEDTTEAAE